MTNKSHRDAFSFEEHHISIHVSLDTRYAVRVIHISCVTRNTTRHARSTFRASSLSLFLSHLVAKYDVTEVYASVRYRWASVNLFMEETRVQLDCDLCAVKRPLTASAFTSNRACVCVRTRFACVRAYTHHRVIR